DIAWLDKATNFGAAERQELLDAAPGFPRGYLPERATGHPVIVLKRLSGASTHVAITTVSAYSSGPANNNLAPWKQRCHRSKKAFDFRSFAGSESSTNRPLLHLGKGLWGKPQTSWVYIQSVYVVPLSVLSPYHRSNVHLQMAPASLNDLCAHIERDCRTWGDVMARLQRHEPASCTTPTLPTPFSRSSSGNSPPTKQAAINTTPHRAQTSVPVPVVPVLPAVQCAAQKPSSWAQVAVAKT
ncbi:hypothetical protein QBC47DRAFT_300208, partial [Echria macrotheca]